VPGPSAIPRFLLLGVFFKVHGCTRSSRSRLLRFSPIRKSVWCPSETQIQADQQKKRANPVTPPESRSARLQFWSSGPCVPPSPSPRSFSPSFPTLSLSSPSLSRAVTLASNPSKSSLLVPRAISFSPEMDGPRRLSPNTQKQGRRRRSSSIIYQEPPESMEHSSDQAALPNLNANWVNAKCESSLFGSLLYPKSCPDRTGADTVDGKTNRPPIYNTELG
jgi:hypothetical protein